MATQSFVPQAPARTGLPNKFTLDGIFALGASGAVSNSGAPTTNGGLTKLTRNSAGNFTVQLGYQVPSGYVITQVGITTRIAAAVAGKARDWQLQSVANQAAATPSIVIQGINASDAAADPEDNATLLITVECQLQV